MVLFWCHSDFTLSKLSTLGSNTWPILVFGNILAHLKPKTNFLQSEPICQSNPGTQEERTVLEKAEEYGCKREKSNPPLADVDVVLPTLEISVGDDFELDLEFINRSDQRRTVQTYVSGSVVYYTGVSSHEFLFETPTVTVQPQKSKKVAIQEDAVI